MRGNQIVLIMPTHSSIMNVRHENDDLTERKNVMTVSKTTRLLEALQRGEELTAKQIASRFEIANPTATVSNLRFAGFAVYANKRTSSHFVLFIDG